MTTTMTMSPAYDTHYRVMLRRTLVQADLPAILADRNGTLPMHDLFGYEMAYYVATPELTDVLGDDGEFGFVLDADGDPVAEALTGTVLCGRCAATSGDEMFYVALQINGEIGDCEDVYCDDCGQTIYVGECD